VSAGNCPAAEQVLPAAATAITIITLLLLLPPPPLLLLLPKRLLLLLLLLLRLTLELPDIYQHATLVIANDGAL
jgi:hypothetical protein